MGNYLSSHWPYLIVLVGAFVLIGVFWLNVKFEKRIYRWLYRRKFFSAHARQRAAELGMDEEELAEVEIGEGWNTLYPELAGSPSPRVRANEMLDKQVKPEWHSALQMELANMPMGQVLFNPPQHMEAGNKYRVVVRVSRNEKVDLTQNLKGKGIPEIENLKIAERLSVLLFGNDFYIQDLNQASQWVEDDGFTEWAWDVTPVKAGELDLMLRVSIRVRLPYGEESKDHPIIERRIKVKSNAVYTAKIFLQKNWKWVITALILPVVGWAATMMWG